METTEHLAGISKKISRLVLAHMALVAGNAFAHEKLGTFYFVADHLPIVFIFSIVPVIAALMIDKKKARQGIVLLLGTIGAALCFNIVDRFFTPAIPLYQSVPIVWKLLYEGSFGIMLVIEVWVMWNGIKIFREVHANDSQNNSTSSGEKIIS